MQTLNLEPFQATALQENRLGAVLVEMNRPIKLDRPIATWEECGNGWSRPRGPHGEYYTSMHWRKAPFTPGEVVECKENYDCDCGICNFCNGGPPPTETIDAIITACEPVYLPELTEDQAKVLGVEPGLMATSEHTFLGGVYEWWIPRVWDAWAWLVRFDTQQKGT